MNRTIGSTLGPRALNVGSFKYFEPVEMLMAIKNILQILSKIEKLDDLIQHYPEFQGIPTLVHPRVADNIFFS
jgi:hypothetical protein